MRKITDRGSRYRRDRRGNIAIMFVLSAPVLLFSVAMAIDASRMFSIHLQMTQVIDTAILATTQGLTLGDIAQADAEQKVLDYINANLDGRTLSSGDVTIDNITIDTVNKTLQVDAHTFMDMTMAGVVGYSQHKIDTTSKAAYSDFKVEVAMVLDVTSSMNDPIDGYGTPTKLEALKTAATDAISTMFAATDSATRVRIGVVPYAYAVNAAPVIDQIQTTGNTSKCVVERTGSEKYTDALPTVSAKIGGISGNNCPATEIVPLTNDQSGLVSAVSALSGGGCTAGQVGVAWGYYMLSENWTPVWPDGSDPAAYADPKTRKYAIIMTDGQFNFAYSSGGMSCNQTYRAKQYAKNLCASMKASGIRVYSIAFDAPWTAVSLMKSCASPDTGTIKYFFDAQNNSELENAFHRIALDIQGLRLVQ